jgi:cbb3-type cytochrome oxidase subunit 3
MKRLVRTLEFTGLTPAQSAAVIGLFWFTLIGALALAWAFRRWNRRQSHRKAVKQVLADMATRNRP